MTKWIWFFVGFAFGATILGLIIIAGAGSAAIAGVV